MLYHFECHIPANTNIPNEYDERIEIGAGIITNIRIFFPWGCANLCGVQLYRYQQQIVPLNRDEYIKGNDSVYNYPTSYDIFEEPFELIIKGFNNDNIFEHKPVVTVTMTKNATSSNLTKLLNLLK